MPAAKKRVIPATSPKSIGFRIAESLRCETEVALATFVARLPEFRDEIDATPLGPDGEKVDRDLDAVRYDLAGLADLLSQLEYHALSGYVPVYESVDPGYFPCTPIDKPVVEPVAYRDSLALIVARMQALADRLETYLQAIGGSDFCTIDYGITGAGIHAERFRAAAWGTRQALRCVAGKVDPDKLSAATAMLAGAMNAEVAAEDGARLG